MAAFFAKYSGRSYDEIIEIFNATIMPELNGSGANISMPHDLVGNTFITAVGQLQIASITASANARNTRNELVSSVCNLVKYEVASIIELFVTNANTIRA